MADLPERTAKNFWPRVSITGPDDCWLWLGYIESNGYGRIHAGKNIRLSAHRVAWQLTNGPIPCRALICHTCDNPPCCNPAHLFASDWYANVADRRAKGRSCSGASWKRVHSAQYKLDDAAARKIKELLREGRSRKYLVSEFHISYALLSMISTGKRWSHVQI